MGPIGLTTGATFTWEDWSGSQDTWIGNVESILGKYEGKRGRSRSEDICTMCIPSPTFVCVKRRCPLDRGCEASCTHLR